MRTPVAGCGRRGFCSTCRRGGERRHPPLPCRSCGGRGLWLHRIVGRRHGNRRACVTLLTRTIQTWPPPRAGATAGGTDRRGWPWVPGRCPPLPRRAWRSGKARIRSGTSHLPRSRLASVHPPSPLRRQGPMTASSCATPTRQPARLCHAAHPDDTDMGPCQRRGDRVPLSPATTSTRKPPPALRLTGVSCPAPAPL